jgi:hypothetical protein
MSPWTVAKFSKAYNGIGHTQQSKPGQRQVQYGRIT